MRALITGITIFLIWGVLSTWYYSFRIFPELQKPEEPPEVLVEPESPGKDTISRVTAEKPDKLLVYFDFDKSEVKQEESINTYTKDCKDFLQQHPDACLMITGYADAIGSVDYNQKLGQRRAEAVKELCILNGLSLNCVKTFSKGESDPIADNKTEEGRAKNRRAVLIIENYNHNIMNMTILISLLAQSRTGAIIEIIILLLVAGLIAYLTAYYYYKPIYMARIRKLEVLYKSLETSCSEKKKELAEVKEKLDSTEKELEELKRQ